ncbi:PBP1A family penicillin-binding protein [Clostridiaceae bacterium 35-E11]
MEENIKKEDVTKEEINENENLNDKERRKYFPKITFKTIRIVFVVVGILFICLAITGYGFVSKVIEDTPNIDPIQMHTLLNEHSIIYDANGEEFEIIQTLEFRENIEINRIPDKVKNAFIAIEDERFERHRGIDLKRIVGALIVDIKERAPIQGASTITQQLIKNLYLRDEIDRENLMNDIKRKIKEAYLAMNVEKSLTKDQILQTYLNTINLGQGAYGIQAAAKTYFDKNVEELTIGESALIAGITKNPSRYAPYLLRLIENIEENNENLIGYIYLIGSKYGVLYNPNSSERQKIVLEKMKQLGFITEEEYETALREDIKGKLKPREKENTEIMSFFSDLVQKEVIEILVKNGISQKEAERKLYTGGLRIYTTIDVAMQKKAEDIYENFEKILAGNIKKRTTPILTEWYQYNGSRGNLDRNQNLVDHHGNILYYKRDNLLTENNAAIIEKNSFKLKDGALEIIRSKFSVFKGYIRLKGFYSIDDKKNLVFHNGGVVDMASDHYTIKDDDWICISKEFLRKNPDFYEIDDKGNLLISQKYFAIDEPGIVQPQSALVILEHSTGKIKAIVGGRKITGRKVLNRATEGYRQPGSTIKPLAVYLPALDNGYTAASVIDDIPHFTAGGRLWPRNWYSGYRGLKSLREIAVNSMNVATVKLLEEIGMETSLKYLERLGIINKDNPSKDSFVNDDENKYIHDENLAALGLGGFTKGLSPLAVTAAYGAIANNGVYIKPTTIEKILDTSGKVFYTYEPEKTMVVEPEIANIMTDILEDVVRYGTGTRASLYPGNRKIPVAGKTGTTTAKVDAWFAGYTPYYAAALWIGNDAPQLSLRDGSRMAAIFWKEVMLKVHEDLSDKDFKISDKLIRKTIDIDTGGVPTSLTSKDPRGNRARTEIFAPGTVPKAHSSIRVEVKVDKTSNKLATPYCPEEDVKVRTYIKTNLPYVPSKNGGYIPNDFNYRVPLKKCDLHYEGMKDVEAEREKEEHKEEVPLLEGNAKATEEIE